VGNKCSTGKPKSPEIEQIADDSMAGLVISLNRDSLREIERTLFEKSNFPGCNP